jgi:hypothetical protein
LPYHYHVILSVAKNLNEGKMEQRHHCTSARFRGRLEPAAGLLGSSPPNGPSKKQITSITTSHMTISAPNNTRTGITTRVSGPRSQPAARVIATIPQITEIPSKRYDTSLKHRFNPLLVTCPTSTGAKPINAVPPTTIAIMSSFVYPHILFRLLFLQLYHSCGGFVMGSLRGV